MIGQKLLHYEIVEKIGEGGMGVVYKARDTHLDRFVAIKLLPPERVADPARKVRFAQEAKAASALNHPNIVTIHDISSDTGVDFIAMEYVAGKTLDQATGRKGLSLNETLKYAIQIADALVRAHAAGIVHRDLKPSNVMVDEHGLVKVLDFGLAKLTEVLPTGEDTPTATLRPSTEEGTIVGTAAYMSPEQAEGQKVDARSDVFSFGALLYEMVSGRRAFQGDSKMSTLSAVLHQEPKPIEDVPGDLKKIINRCLRKQPERRFQHMDDVRIALEDLKEESDSGHLTGVPEAERKRPRRWAWLAGAAAAILLAAVLLWRTREGKPAEDLKAVALTAYPGHERTPSFSPDGKKVAFGWNGEKEDNYDIYVKQIGASGPPMRLTTDPAQDRYPAWSPDDRWIAFSRSQKDNWAILLKPPLGGPERKLTEVPLLSFLSWTPDGKWLVFSAQDSPPGPSSIWAVSVETGERRRLTQLVTGSQGPLGDSNPSISPDGRALAFARQVIAHRVELYTLRLTPDLRPEGEPAKVANQYYAGVVGVAWTAGGREIVYSADGTLWRAAVSGQRPPIRLPYALPQSQSPTIASQPPRLAYTLSMGNSILWRLDTRTGERTKLIISSVSYDGAPQYSPDGRKLAFNSGRNWSSQIWTCDADGSNCAPLTSSGAPYCALPRWSPDGRWLTFSSNPEGNSEIYVIAADGGAPRRLTRHDATDNISSFSRDGRWVYFASDRSGRYEVWKMPAEGGEAVQLTRSGGYGQFESPDGNLYYTKYPEPSPLFRMPVGGGTEEQVLPRVVAHSAFGVTAKGVYFMDGHAIQFLDAATKKISTLATGVGGNALTNYLGASADDTYVVWPVIDSIHIDLMLVEGFR